MAIDQSLDRTSELKKHAHELVKQFIVYDVNNRVTTIFTALTDAPNNAICERTDYTYIDATSSLIEKRKESLGTWLAIWDI